ncbi:hypothetical protein AGLY_010860 [Aphis glycines]|uniref:Tc1-like transposase DDE domain-containing protein n=1 Tax=Aphis glycines TaxID=307491 RepID=A0A6G0TFD7_APHGL|nr:hypothetical protein AGLY_010860 [Aphis glycines]
MNEIAIQMGHEVIRLPPYHCKYNPIELIWAEVKAEVAKSNNTFKMTDVEKLAHAAIIDAVTQKDWEKTCTYIGMNFVLNGILIIFLSKNRTPGEFSSAATFHSSDYRIFTVPTYINVFKVVDLTQKQKKKRYLKLYHFGFMELLPGVLSTVKHSNQRIIQALQYLPSIVLASRMHQTKPFCPFYLICELKIHSINETISLKLNSLH